MARFFKSLFLLALFLTSAYFFGLVSKHINEAYSWFLIPSPAIITLALMFFGALFGLVVTSGLVAALIRPFWMGCVVFAFGAFGLMLGWNVIPGSSVLLIAYFIGSLIFYAEVMHEVSNRVKFSVRAITISQGTLFLTFAFVASGNFYLGCQATIEKEGFAIPQYYVQIVQRQAEKKLQEQVPPSQREAMLEKFREDFPKSVADFTENTIRPNQRQIPLALSSLLFTFLLTLMSLFQAVIAVLFGIIFKLLIATRFVHIVPEFKEVQHLTIE